jgi:RNA polymerase sigma-70 factor, ECF subfamily
MSMSSIAFPSAWAEVHRLMGRLFASRLARPRSPGSLDSGTDETLVWEVLNGNPRAFDDLYARHVDAVWRRLTHLLGPDPDREDLAQQIFVEVFRGLARFRGDATFRTYLHRVVINTAYDQLGRRRRRPQQISDDAVAMVESAEASPESRAQQRERLALTWRFLDRVKPKKRVAFVLRVVEGLSLEQVGILVGASVATVAQRVRHAHAELQEMMNRREEGA